jgi:nicotinate (nicotinamide) nucleotide adenylyltransferase
MEFVRGGPRGTRPGILAGAFNPPTIAHLALIDAAQPYINQVICVLPREFPHKSYHGATLAERLEMLDRIAAERQIDVAVAERGLFIDIAWETRAAFARPVDIAFICGSDAAERILTWDYGHPGAIEEMLEEFRLLVADRDTVFQPRPDLARRVEALAIPAGVGSMSSTDVRRRIAAGEPWHEFVPPQIHDLVTSIYGRML